MAGINPFLFPHIAQEVLSYIPARELEKNRRVCKIWDDEASRILQKRRLVSFRCVEEVKVYYDAMRETQQFPHVRFQFLLDDMTGLVDEVLQEFWKAFGAKIEHLDLQQSHTFWRDLASVIGDTTLPKLSSLYLKHLPMHIWEERSFNPAIHQVKSVKLLKLGSIPFIDGGVNGAMERLLDLMKFFPNLEEIKFSPHQDTPSDIWDRVSTILSDVLVSEDVHLPNLQKIGTKLVLDNEKTLKMTVKTFSFEVLEVSFKDDLKIESVILFFSSIQSTLKSLKFNLPEHIQLNRIEELNKGFKMLKNLDALEIKYLIRQPTFITGMPALRKFKFGTTGLSNVLMPSGSRFRKLLISDLEIYNNISTQSVTEIERIRLFFPMTNRLSLNKIDDGGLGVIFRSLPLLSYLELIDSQITDQGISGLPMRVCIDYNATFPKAANRGTLNHLRTELYIGSLQYLRELRICAPQMTDAGIVFGINEMAQLKKLKLDSNEITDDGILLLVDEMKNRLCYLDISLCPRVTILSVIYAESKIRGDLLVDNAVDVTRARCEQRYLKNSDIGYVELRGHDIARTHHPSIISRYSNFFIGVDQPIHWISRTRVADPSNTRIRHALERHQEFMLLLKALGYNRFMKSFRQGILNEMRRRGHGTRETRIINTEQYEFGNDLIPDNFVVKMYKVGVTIRDVEHWLNTDNK
ncbi:unnamed protein product [Orchesella dallaii]|uniref:F-box domain-containing protein n=1 Tax=Orchesella dallaii TaxID=48710 RepID=A0ABP1QB49_9HEXA